MDDSLDLNLFAFLHEPNAQGTAAANAADREDPLVCHLQECKSVALKQARKTFIDYKNELDRAFSLDLADASAHSQSSNRSRVVKVLDEFRHDVQHMTDTITELTEVACHIAVRQKALKKRAQVANEGLERLRAAKLRVYAQVSERTAGVKLPSAVLLFLLQPWSDYLCFTDLRFGPDGEAWHQALAVMDKLIWAVTPKHSPSDQALLAQLRRPLQECIGAGLRTIRYDTGKTRALQDAIESLFERVSSCAPVATADETYARELKSRAARHAHQYVPPKDPEEILEREVLSRLRKLEFGTEFKIGNRRMRLAWFNGKTSHYMLVDDQHGVAQLLPGRQLARALLERKALLLSGGPTRGSRAADRIKRSLKQVRAACWSIF